MWMVYLGTDGNNVTLLDTNDTSNPVPIDTFIPPASLTWFIGNGTGAFIHTSDGKGSQLSVNSSSKVVPTCVLSC